MIKIGILGAAGYTGGELIRLLINHPEAEIVFANSLLNSFTVGAVIISKAKSMHDNVLISQ